MEATARAKEAPTRTAEEVGGNLSPQRVCLDCERISVRIILFGLVVKNSVGLVISQKI
jgi:hypothetical protein